jgi:hypothetical protein
VFGHLILSFIINISLLYNTSFITMPMHRQKRTDWSFHHVTLQGVFTCAVLRDGGSNGDHILDICLSTDHRMMETKSISYDGVHNLHHAIQNRQGFYALSIPPSWSQGVNLSMWNATVSVFIISLLLTFKWYQASMESNIRQLINHGSAVWVLVHQQNVNYSETT